jgi:4-amino-4-deoxy-L-arabinose transferase-like glycosyltransferase
MRTEAADSFTVDGEERQFFSPAVRLFVVAVLFVASFAIRIYAIAEPPLEFHPIRQYRYVLVARAYYFDSLPSLPNWKRQLARTNQQDLRILEPPIMPYLAYIGYRIAGAEYLWIPKALSVLFWLIGGGFLYLIGRRLLSGDGAVFALAFYLFLPFGIFASRSFQPDPLMLMMLLVSLYSIIRYDEAPSFKALGIAATASAVAVLVKPVSIFFICGGFLSLALYKEPSWWRALMRLRLMLFFLMTALPLVSYYSYGIFVGNFLQRQAEESFVPFIIFYPFFWRAWFQMIGTVIGETALILAALGVLTLRDKQAKAFLVGLWIGYMIFGLVFAYHVHTHNYYQLPFIPVIALSLGALGTLVMARLNRVCTEWHWRSAAWCVLVAALLLPVLAYAGARRLLPDFAREVEIAREAGEAVAHSDRTLLLSSKYERALRYHGELYGVAWPRGDELRWERFLIQRQVGAEERFKSLTLNYPADYFVVTDLREFERQEDLKRFLTGRFRVLTQNSGYLVFDLRKNSG